MDYLCLSLEWKRERKSWSLLRNLARFLNYNAALQKKNLVKPWRWCIYMCKTRHDKYDTSFLQPLWEDRIGMSAIINKGLPRFQVQVLARISRGGWYPPFTGLSKRINRLRFKVKDWFFGSIFFFFDKKIDLRLNRRSISIPTRQFTVVW